MNAALPTINISKNSQEFQQLLILAGEEVLKESLLTTYLSTRISLKLHELTTVEETDREMHVNVDTLLIHFMKQERDALQGRRVSTFCKEGRENMNATLTIT